jgi:hypothetical protein
VVGIGFGDGLGDETVGKTSLVSDGTVGGSLIGLLESLSGLETRSKRRPTLENTFRCDDENIDGDVVGVG